MASARSASSTSPARAGLDSSSASSADAIERELLGIGPGRPPPAQPSSGGADEARRSSSDESASNSVRNVFTTLTTVTTAGLVRGGGCGGGSRTGGSAASASCSGARHSRSPATADGVSACAAAAAGTAAAGAATPADGGAGRRLRHLLRLGASCPARLSGARSAPKGRGPATGTARGPVDDFTSPAMVMVPSSQAPRGSLPAIAAEPSSSEESSSPMLAASGGSGVPSRMRQDDGPPVSPCSDGLSSCTPAAASAPAKRPPTGRCTPSAALPGGVAG